MEQDAGWNMSVNNDNDDDDDDKRNIRDEIWIQLLSLFPVFNILLFPSSVFAEFAARNNLWKYI